LQLKVVGDGTGVGTLQSKSNQLAARNQWHDPLQGQELNDEAKPYPLPAPSPR
jgi:hypothetical protein